MIFAAGGVVWRTTQGGKRIAVVHRARYNDWSLPKGNIKNGESWEAAALREVREETGCRARIVATAGSVSYRVDGEPKTVLFFQMEASGEGAFRESEEVKDVIWLSPEEAMKKISYAGEKEMIAKTMVPDEDLWTKLNQWKAPDKPRGSHTTYSRLISELGKFLIDVQARIRRQKAERAPWAVVAARNLERAHDFIASDDIDAAWRCYHAAARAELDGLSGEELAAATTSLRCEATKLSGWRRRAIFTLIGDREPGPRQKKDRVPDKASLYAAVLLRDEYFDNLYFKINHRRKNLQILRWVLIPMIVVLPVMAALGALPAPIQEWKQVLSAELLGMIGAIFSVALTLTSRSLDEKIPDQVIGAFITWMRPMIGALAGIAAFILGLAGILPKILSDNLGQAPGVLLAFAFISGFSERLVIKAITSVSETEKEDGRGDTGTSS